MARILLAAVSIGLLCSQPSGAEPADTAPSARRALTLDELRSAREEAKFRRRRIIVNNDGNDKVRPPYTVERFLAARTAGLADSQVDTIFYCSGVPMLYTHRSKIAEQTGVGIHQDAPNKEWVAAFNEMDTDSLEMVVNWSKEHDKEVFWSMRLNDRHDSSPNWPWLITEWKRSHPELLMGTEEGGLPDHFERGKKSWSAMRYDKPEVRQTVFDLIEEVCTNYDIDGVELDFWRHPLYFTEPLEGKPVPQAKMDEMTELWRRVRQMTERIGRQRGRPFLIAIRIPDSMDYCRAMGLDVEKWLEDDLVDIVTGADYFKLEPWENLAATGKKYDVPVYACFEIRRVQGKENRRKTDVKLWRGEAYNAWKAGVDGIYLMNRFDPRDPLTRQLGDPELLESLPRVDQTSYYRPDNSFKPQDFVPDGLKYLKQPPPKSNEQ
ncbi:hypothetical protein [Aeoliella sp.]|uniref:hypothetical protein n=1 Tax=Aeoliella sp. TaxID=2795800 RepID=UPI003CCBDD73